MNDTLTVTLRELMIFEVLCEDGYKQEYAAMMAKKIDRLLAVKEHEVSDV
jgi:hypothetical protein